MSFKVGQRVKITKDPNLGKHPYGGDYMKFKGRTGTIIEVTKTLFKKVHYKVQIDNMNDFWIWKSCSYLVKV